MVAWQKLRADPIAFDSVFLAAGALISSVIAWVRQLSAIYMIVRLGLSGIAFARADN